MADKLDSLVEMRQSLTASDFQATLSYYSIPVKKHSILCPFHNDTHYGSCSINRDGKSATCWVCPSQKPGKMGRTISPVDLVMHFQNMEFAPALEYLWTNILGRSLPEYHRSSGKKSFPLDMKQLELIGIEHASGGMIPVAVNVCHRAEKVPDDCKAERLPDLDSEDSLVIKKMKVESIYSLYETDREAVLWLLRGKAAEAKRYFLDLIGDTFDRDSKNWEMYCFNREGTLELRKTLHAKVAAVRKIISILEREAA